MSLSKKVKGAAVVGAILAVAALAAPGWSADHRDAPATTADPASDINDLFTFLDTGRVVVGMTVTPFAGAGAVFSNTTQYVFHTSSGAAFGATTTNEDIICTFDTSQKISCWAGTDDYVTGDASSATTPLTSTSGKMKVFAGMRSDPFFFNLQGFKDAVSAVEGAASGLTLDGSGCPAVNATTASAIGGLLSETTSSNAPSKTTADDFTTANTLAIVLSLDPSLVNKGGKMISVWASTNKAP
jgi:hypothetical protein